MMTYCLYKCMGYKDCSSIMCDDLNWKIVEDKDTGSKV